MPLSNPVIRRYTPPTCTLEIWAQKSPISRWAKQSVLKQLTFELQLDDPRLSEEDKVTIRGDREQLEALCTKVSDYVQELLQKDTENFWLSFQGSQANHQVINEPPPQDLSRSAAFARNSNNDNPNTDNSNSGFSQTPVGSIRLQPDTHLKHKLFLGSLANQSTGEFVQLGLLQLFDLASALENYSAEFIALPTTTNNTSRRTPLSTWGPVAAVVAIAAGLTPVTWQYANRLREEQIATKSSPKEESVALNSSPLQELPTAVPTLNPPTPLPTQSPLTSDLPLSVSPLPPVSSISPQTSIAGQAQKPQTTISTPSQGSSDTTSFTKPLTSGRDTLTIPGAQSNQIGTSSITVPTPKAQNSQTAIRPNLPQNSSASIGSKSNAPGTITNPATSTLTTTNNLSPRNINETPKPSGINSPNISLGSPSDSESDSASTSDLINKLRQNRPGNSSKIAAGNSDVFDPKQIAEVKEYLKQRWQPPSGLTQALEYSLTVGVDGSIERILPLGKAARENVSSTGMPAIGQPFISPSKNGQDARIRAVFKPDGKVQAFPETE